MSSEPAAVPERPTPPPVENAEVAAALQELVDLDDLPLAEHQARLSRVHEVLHGVLHPEPDGR